MIKQKLLNALYKWTSIFIVILGVDGIAIPYLVSMPDTFIVAGTALVGFVINVQLLAIIFNAIAEKAKEANIEKSN